MKRTRETLCSWSDFETFDDTQSDPGWSALYQREFAKPYFSNLCKQIRADHSRFKGEIPIYPPRSLVFSAFDMCPLEAIQVVIIGQDPYHGKDQAMGLCFSVPPTVKIPPSLRNMYRELVRDPNVNVDTPPSHGDLTAWAKQGVLLLNSALTVRMGSAGSHSQFGWQPFTDAIIQHLSDTKSEIVFLLWGQHAQERGRLIDQKKHSILKSSHPSPYSVKRGFEGCGHFSKCNDLLVKAGKRPINWKVEK